MDMHKTFHDLCQAGEHFNLPLIVGMIGSVRFNGKIKTEDKFGDLGDVPGDNVLPKKILNSLISRRSL
jgi:hypothetical protein